MQCASVNYKGGKSPLSRRIVPTIACPPPPPPPRTGQNWPKFLLPLPVSFPQRPAWFSPVVAPEAQSDSFCSSGILWGVGAQGTPLLTILWCTDHTQTPAAIPSLHPLSQHVDSHVHLLFKAALLSPGRLHPSLKRKPGPLNHVSPLLCFIDQWRASFKVVIQYEEL